MQIKDIKEIFLLIACACTISVHVTAQSEMIEIVSQDGSCISVSTDMIRNLIVKDLDYELYYYCSPVRGDSVIIYDMFFIEYANDLRGYSACDHALLTSIFSPPGCYRTPDKDEQVKELYLVLKGMAYGATSGLPPYLHMHNKNQNPVFRVKDEVYYQVKETLGFFRGHSFINEDEERAFLNPDSLVRAIIQNSDTIQYKKAREYVIRGYYPYDRIAFTEKDLLIVARFLADSLHYQPAYYDVYACYDALRTYNHHPMSQDDFNEAHRYLQMGIDQGDLPCIWKEALLRLTGTYVPQDTISGKELFYQCIEGDCKIPFWRYEPSSEPPYKNLLILRDSLLKEEKLKIKVDNTAKEQNN